VAVASAEPYASLHLAPDRQPHHSVFTGRMPFLPPNQQRQSTEDKIIKQPQAEKTLLMLASHSQKNSNSPFHQQCNNG